jgi:hypothetical protein
MAHTSHTDIPETDTARASCAPDIFQSKTGNADCARRNSWMTAGAA